MAVALIDGRIGGEAVEVTVAFGIPHPDALAARQNDADRLVVIGAKAQFSRDEIIGWRIHLRHRALCSINISRFARFCRRKDVNELMAIKVRLRTPLTHRVMSAYPNNASHQSYSITLSARASSVGGTARPRSLAVLRLMVSSYLVGTCTGRSAGFVPLRMRST